MDRSVSVPVYLAGEIEVPGTEAIEVIAMRGDEVESVAHLTDPKGGQVSRTTRVMLASGAAAVVSALGIFFATVYAWSNASAARDFFAFALLAYGVTVIVRGLRRRADELVPADFTTDSGHTLVRARAGGWDMVTPAGEVTPLVHGTRLVVDVGAYRYFVQTTARPRSHAQPLLGGVRWDDQRYLAGSAIAHALVLIGLLSVPRDARALNQDNLPEIIQLTRVFVAPPEETALAKQIDKLPGEGAKAGPTARKGAGPEGKAGSSKIKNKDGAIRVRGPANNPDPAIAKSLARDAALNAGPLRYLGDRAASSTGSIWGREHALGADAESNLGNLTALLPGDAAGEDGLGLRGKGRGGGGDAAGSMGLARIGIPGLSSGQRGMGSHVGNFNLRHKATAPEILGPPEIKGRIDKDIIRRIVRRHLNEVKYCYEQEAMRRPNIGGRLVVQFTIGGNGVVSNSTVAASMGDSVVDGCVTQAVRRWEFPQPEGGGIVIVSYPFVLTLAGS